MSGERLNSKMNRRNFIKTGALLLSIPLIKGCKTPEKNLLNAVRISGANFKRGHEYNKLRLPEPETTAHIPVLIVGGGVAGLSAARWLLKSGFKDFTLVELEDHLGGNSRSSENTISPYPLGAHYLPIPDENNKKLLEFLEEINVINGFNADNLPVYNEYYLCREPHERVFYRGIWQDGIIPKSSLSDVDRVEILRFQTEVERLKKSIGTDGQAVFKIPLENCSKQTEYLALDKISALDYLRREKYTSSFLYDYLSYCCRDDYGAPLDKVSSWALFHYFCSRKGKAANAHAGELLTWPEGNGFLVNGLKKEIQPYCKTKHRVHAVKRNDNFWECIVVDYENNTTKKIIAKAVVFATPQFINKKLLGVAYPVAVDHFSYYPWLVANISINDKKALNARYPLAWDNVILHSGALGYVNACHQSFREDKQEIVITYYYVFLKTLPKAEREKIYRRTKEEWNDFILSEISKVHPDIKENFLAIDVHLWGHGMISPEPGFMSCQARQALRNGYEESNLFFAHSDISGISIFEQAFYNGIAAAEKALKGIEHKE